MKAHTEWTVLPHDPIEKRSESVWRIEGSLPGMPLRRVMTAVRLSEGDLVIHNGIALDDAARAELERWGTPRWLIVPNGWHRLDAPAYKKRYPGMKVLCPAGSRKKVEEVIAVDGSYADFPARTDVRLEHLEGTRDAEGVLVVRDGDGTTLVLNDCVFNQPHLPGAFGTIYRWLRQSGQPKVTLVSRLFLLKDKRAFADHLRRLADEPNLREVIVSHLHPITDAPDVVLRRLADELSS